MSRTKQVKKSPGAEFWSRRPGSNRCGSGPGPSAKKRTHRLERIEGKEEAEAQALADDAEREIFGFVSDWKED